MGDGTEFDADLVPALGVNVGMTRQLVFLVMQGSRIR
jgi:hypothetical protein